MMKYLDIFISIMLIGIGIKIIFLKKISQGNASTKIGDIYLGNYTFVIGGFFIFLGSYILFYMYKKKQKSKNGEN